MDRLLGFAPEAALDDLGLLLWGQGVEVVQLLKLEGFWQHQVLRGAGDCRGPALVDPGWFEGGDGVGILEKTYLITDIEGD